MGSGSGERLSFAMVGGELTDSDPPFSAREPQYPEERRFLMSFAQAQIMGKFRSLRVPFPERFLTLLRV